MPPLAWNVRRQIIWRRLRRKLAECRPRLGVDVRRRACGAASADVRWSVPFALFDDGFGPSGIGRGHVVQALVLALVVIMIDERLDLGLRVTGQEIVFQQEDMAAVSIIH